MHTWLTQESHVSSKNLFSWITMETLLIMAMTLTDFKFCRTWIHPERLLCYSEYLTRLDRQITKNKSEGQVGGMRYNQANVTASTTDIRFTLLPILNALGDPIRCVTVVQAEMASTHTNWFTCIELMTLIVVDADNETFMKKNSDAGWMMSGGPSCGVGNTRTSCFVTVGVVTSQLRAHVRKYLDNHSVFPRDPG